MTGPPARIARDTVPHGTVFRCYLRDTGELIAERRAANDADDADLEALSDDLFEVAAPFVAAHGAEAVLLVVYDGSSGWTIPSGGDHIAAGPPED